MNDEPARILVVDDELGMREGCRRILVAEGFHVETAGDGLAALNVFKERPDFAVALVDLKMPQMGGLELIQHLRELNEDTVIFVITAYAAIDTAVEATRRGAYGYIPKPFTPDELLLPIRNGLERRSLSLEGKRLRAERESRLLEVAAERSKCNTIISCMTDGVLVINRDRQIVLRNTAAGRILPELAEISLFSPLDCLACASLRGLLDEALLAGGETFIASREITLGDSTYMTNISPVHEPNGGVAGAVAVLRDITALKKLETAKSMFVSMVAHEVKSPLAAIEGNLMTVLSGLVDDQPERARQMLDRAMVRAKALRTMVSDLLNLTAMETGNFNIKRSPLDITAVLEEAVESARDKAAERRIALVFEDQSVDVKILADPDSMLMVFGNLIDNAIKYGVDGGHVRIRLDNDGMYVRVTVEDDGIGMTPAEKESIFDEFFRAKNEQTMLVPGTGLGLTIVRRLVEMHNGKVSVQSEPRSGSTFVVSLPVAE